MGIDFWYYTQIQLADGTWEDRPEYQGWDEFRYYFSDRGFYKSNMARVLGYPEESYPHKLKRTDDTPRHIQGNYLFYRSLKQLEGIMRWHWDDPEYIEFRVLLARIRIEMQVYGWKDFRLIVATDFT